MLGAMGTIGGAAALGGASTMAFFSDEEEFANNQLTAGELDLKASWEEHYSDWSPDENDVGDTEFEIVMWEGAPNTTGTQADLPSGYTGFPTPGAWLIAVPNENADDFMANTLEEQFPSGGVNPGVDICEQLDDVQDYSPAPRINLGDVKPGDFGEVTLDFAICDNPGYVWMTGGLVEARENGVNDPEGDDDDESGPTDEVSTDIDNQVELLDAVQTCLWYDDNCDNQLQQEPEPYCLDLIIDTSGSMELSVYDDGDPTISKKEAANIIGTGVIEGLDDIDGDDGTIGPAGSLAAVDSFANDAANLQGLTDDESDLLDAVDTAEDNTSTGDTNTVAALEQAIDTLDDCPHDQRYVVLLTNAPPTSSATRASIEDAAERVKGTDTGGGSGDFLDPGATVKVVALDVDEDSTQEDFWEGVASDPTEVFTVQQNPSVGSPGGDDDVRAEIQSSIDAIVNQIPVSSGSEEKIFTGSLRETLLVLEEGAAGPLQIEDDIGIPLEGDLPAEQGGGTGRNCYSPNTRHCIGFAWWLPVDHANEIQTDSVTFDLSFYTEQCRHNDGSGMANS